MTRALFKMVPVLLKMLTRRRGSRIRRWHRRLERGEFQPELAVATAAGGLVTSFEIGVEHYRASFGDPWMWTPLAITPPLVAAGIGGAFSRRIAQTALPVTSALYLVNGLLGVYLHVRGVAKRPGGFREATYNVVMGPPLMAPGLMTMVGGMGLLAALLRRGTAR
jgi:hypothetical protein